MALVNHLKNKDAQSKTLTIATGRHLLSGHLCYSYTVGASPNHQIFLYHALGEGEWDDAPEAIWWNGLNIAPENYHYHRGKISFGFDDPVQGVDSWFDKDVPHSSTATIAVRLPVNVGEADTLKNTPNGLTGIFRCLKFPDFDANGNQTGFGYTANPARCLVGIVLLFAQLPTSPPTYQQQLAQNFLNRIDWQRWTAWRDYCAGLEPVDYTQTESQGIGVTASFYTGENFETFVQKRIEPVIDFQMGNGSPVAGTTADHFSIRVEGKIKPSVSGAYTLHLTHDDGVKLWINNQLIIGSATATPIDTAEFTFQADTFYDLKIEYFEITGEARLRLEWELPLQQGETVRKREIIQPANLYPKPGMRPRYESHVYCSSPTTLEQIVSTILTVSNSAMQDSDGKLKFFCYEQQTETVFHFIEDVNVKAETIESRRVNFFEREIRNSWEAKFRDLDSQYLTEPDVPVKIEFEELQEKAGRKIEGAPLDLFNMTRWQAVKVLKFIAEREVLHNLLVSFEGTAETFPIETGDLVMFTSPTLGFTEKRFIVEEDSDVADDVESRTFVLREYQTSAESLTNDYQKDE